MSYPEPTDLVMTEDGREFTRSCLFGASYVEGIREYHCDGYGTDGSSPCGCPCHEFWNGTDNLAEWHHEFVKVRVSRHEPPSVTSAFGPSLDNLVERSM